MPSPCLSSGRILNGMGQVLCQCARMHVTLQKGVGGLDSAHAECCARIIPRAVHNSHLSRGACGGHGGLRARGHTAGAGWEGKEEVWVGRKRVLGPRYWDSASKAPLPFTTKMSRSLGGFAHAARPTTGRSRTSIKFREMVAKCHGLSRAAGDQCRAHAAARVATPEDRVPRSGTRFTVLVDSLYFDPAVTSCRTVGKLRAQGGDGRGRGCPGGRPCG